MNGLLWFLANLAFFLVVQRWLHREIQAVLLLSTRRLTWTVGTFSLIFLPGVLLHETSHFIAARLLGVPTGKFSLIPAISKDGSLQLGFVETAKTDFLRDSLIGLAPLVTGGILVAWWGIRRLGFVPAATQFLDGNWQVGVDQIINLPMQADFWLWFYLAFVVSSTMLPSAADRKGWVPLAFVIALLVIVALLTGAGGWMAVHVAPILDRTLGSVAVLFGISLVIHLVLVIPFFLLHRLISRATRMDVQ